MCTARVKVFKGMEGSSPAPVPWLTEAAGSDRNTEITFQPLAIAGNKAVPREKTFLLSRPFRVHETRPRTLKPCSG